MPKARDSTQTVIALLLVFSAMCAYSQTRGLDLSEAKPVLDVVSRLHPITVVDGGPYMSFEFPHICWIESPAFRKIVPVLASYPGPFQWGTFVSLPRRCLVVQPNVSRGESPFIKGTSGENATPQQMSELENHLRRFGVPVDWSNSPQIDANEYKSRVVQAMPKMATYLEEQLGLKDRPSLGITTSNDILELPLIHDQRGPGRGVVLAADPIKYSRERISTSRYDRAIHYWITDEEADELWAAIRTNPTNWPILSRVAGATDGGAIMSSDEVPKLNSEVDKLAELPIQPGLRDALKRISSVCESAKSYHLGIYVPGQ
jgi:hypothetical protein